MEEFQRALSSRGVTVASIPGKGRGLVTTRDFSPGEVIICQEPYASAPNKASVGLICDACFSSKHVKKCSACRVACYCGPACQKSEWKLHQVECKALVALSDERRKMLTPTIRLMVQLILRAKLQQDQVIPASETNNYDLIKALESHMSAVGEDQLVVYAQMANLVRLVLPSLDLDLKEISHNFSKLSCNAHTICDTELRPIGTGLFPIVSMINHSCLPNSVLIFEGNVAHVRATESIPKNTEVMISYIETAFTKEKRQSELRQYFFTCTCSRCLKSYAEEDVYLEGYRCSDHKCTGVSLFLSDQRAFICQQCGAARDAQEVERIKSGVMQLSEKASTVVSTGNYTEAYSTYKAIEQVECDLYHPFSLNILKTHENLLKISMELKDWKSALTYCRLTIEAYQRVYPAIHPMIGLQFYTCGKIEWLLEYTDDAIRSYTKAADILRITHGTTSPFMRELLASLEEARTEASYKHSSRERF
ncbi:N-lysine methyltransferase SMYD2 [Rhynchospora pubera]|uniref:N-lysine methyltransferase SMYD2 n=1 Tax=Rhynchospora pubera TaxID=906938 RepID=A0AAV8CJA3_9POAL|nr:N-lysine methyltransferase SMYD2 [Rhynchospora pubera]